MPSSSPLPAQTVGRAALLLRIIASSQSRHLRLLDIATMAALDKSTAQRLLHRLVIERLLVRDPARGYRLGPLLYELGLSALPETNLREVCQAPLQALAQSTGDMVFLILRSGFETVCLNRIAGSFPIQTMTRTEGDRHPLGVGAGGGAILASMHDSDIELTLPAIAPRLPAYHLTDKAVLAAIEATRARGDIAIDEGSAAFDVTAIGRTIHDATQAPVAAIFVASIQHRMAQARQKQVAKELMACVNGIENMWGKSRLRP
jgi:DNA-binding IclR family transcriptional regulator